MSKYIVRFTRPNGTTCYLAWGGVEEKPENAFAFNSETAARRSGHARIHGDPCAFWESERKSAQIARDTHKGWAFDVQPAMAVA